MIALVRHRCPRVAVWLLAAVFVVQSALTAAMPLQMAMAGVTDPAPAQAHAQAPMPADMDCCDEREAPAMPDAGGGCECDCSLFTALSLPSVAAIAGAIALPAIRRPADVPAWELSRRASPPLRPPISANA